MSTHLVLSLAHWFAALLVLAEALNKLERTNLFARGIGYRARLALVLKVIAWLALSVGAAGAIVSPLLWHPISTPALADVLVICGFATLIIRTRVQDEFVSNQPPTTPPSTTP